MAEHKLTLTSWQLAQLERLVEDQLNQMRRDGLASHPVTVSYEALLKKLQEVR